MKDAATIIVMSCIAYLLVLLLVLLHFGRSNFPVTHYCRVCICYGFMFVVCFVPGIFSIIIKNRKQ